MIPDSAPLGDPDYPSSAALPLRRVNANHHRGWPLGLRDVGVTTTTPAPLHRTAASGMDDDPPTSSAPPPHHAPRERRHRRGHGGHGCRGRRTDGRAARRQRRGAAGQAATRESRSVTAHLGSFEAPGTGTGTGAGQPGARGAESTTAACRRTAARRILGRNGGLRPSRGRTQGTSGGTRGRHPGQRRSGQNRSGQRRRFWLLRGLASCLPAGCFGRGFCAPLRA